MNIKERLNNDLKIAMKNNDTFRRDTLRLLNAALKQVEVDKRITLDDNEIIKILLNAKKQRLDSIESYKMAKRDDLIQKETQELEIIMQYLPKQLDENELREKINAIIISLKASGLKDLGKVMAASKELQQVADGSKISSIAKELLSAI